MPMTLKNIINDFKKIETDEFFNRYFENDYNTDISMLAGKYDYSDFNDLLADIESSAYPIGEEEMISDMYEYIVSKLQNEHNLAGILDELIAMGGSLDMFNKAFKRESGMTINIHSYDEAIEIANNPEYRHEVISAIATACYFIDNNNFSIIDSIVYNACYNIARAILQTQTK